VIQSDHYTPEHEIFRRSFRSFLERDILPSWKQWQAAGQTPHSLWKKAGAAGFLFTKMSADYGGGGGDLYHCLVIMEEQTRVGANELTFYLHSDIIAP
jgi:acyl-CoA dehydrogenase